MDFPSFIPKRDGTRKRALPRGPKADPDATAVNPPWQNMLSEHLQAQSPPPNPHDPPRTWPPVGIHHQPPPLPPQQHIPAKNLNLNDATMVFPKIGKPPVGFQFPITPHNPPPPKNTNSPPKNPNPTPAPPTNSPADPTDITQIMQSAYNAGPMQTHRVLRYYGDGGGIRVVVGYQVHKSSVAGVVFTENGSNPRRVLLPWHRVYELIAAPGDPILENIP